MMVDEMRTWDAIPFRKLKGFVTVPGFKWKRTCKSDAECASNVYWKASKSPVMVGAVPPKYAARR